MRREDGSNLTKTCPSTTNLTIHVCAPADLGLNPVLRGEKLRLITMTRLLSVCPLFPVVEFCLLLDSDGICLKVMPLEEGNCFDF